MTAADLIAKARALIEPLTGLHDAATPGDLSTAEIKEADWFECPHCSGVAEVQAEQFINYDGVAANVLFSGIGTEFGANRDWYMAICRDWPKVRDTIEALLDDRYALMQRIAELEAALRLHKAWFDSESAGPNYGGQTRATHPHGERIWRQWWDGNLDLCDRAQRATDAALQADEAAP